MLPQGEIAQSLGRNDTIVLNGSHIAQMMPNNVSKIFSDWIGISICNYSTHALFQCDPGKLKSNNSACTIEIGSP
jgi:hypothetical protein